VFSSDYVSKISIKIKNKDIKIICTAREIQLRIIKNQFRYLSIYKLKSLDGKNLYYSGM